MRNIQEKRSFEEGCPERNRKGGRTTGENDVTEAVKRGVFFLRKSKRLRVSTVTEKSREIMT